MYRVRYGRNRWRTKWPLRKWFPPVADERFCKKCGLPFQNGPQPKPVATFASGNVGAFVYPAGGWKRDQLVIQFGRWKSVGREFQLSGYVLEDDLKDLGKVTVQAHRYIARRRKKSRRR